jgi:uncharacterized protein (TIGR02996 family)
MSALDGLLQAIHDDPAEETSWLVLSDWLEEHDETARAELLRLHRALRKRQSASLRRQREERLMALLASGVRPVVLLRTTSIGLDLALIPAGSFRMGSPRREARRMEDEHLRTVTISKAFYLSVHLVTQQQFQLVTGSNPSHFTADRAECKGLDTERFPVESATWYEAQQFCERLTERERTREQGWEYRLATESEWEYAARAWLSSRWPFHYGAALYPQQANFNGRYPYPPDNEDPNGVYLERPTVVGSYAPNAFGLFDMHGNLDEWCLDWDSEMEPGDTTDPQGPPDGMEKIVRGGSWRGQGEDCRSAVRIGEDPDARINYVGFRVALVRMP